MVSGRLPEYWIGEYERGNAQEQSQILQVMREAGIQAAFFTPWVIRALHDSHQGVREMAVTTLRRIGPAAGRVVPGADIVAALDAATPRVAADDPFGSMKVHITAALADYGAVSIPFLARLLSDPADGVRSQAARSLGTLGVDAQGALDALVAVLGDPAEAVRVDAALAILQIDIGHRTEILTPILERGLRYVPKVREDENLPRSLKMAEALARLGHEPAAIRYLRDAVLPTKSDAEESSYVARTRRRDAAAALGRLGVAAREAIPALGRCLVDPSNEIREAAEDALMQIDEGAARSVIASARERERRYAGPADSASARRVPRALRKDIQQFVSADAAQRVEAAIRLRQHDPAMLVEAIPFFLARLDDDEVVERFEYDLTSVRTAGNEAARILETIGAPAVEALVNVLGSEGLAAERAAEALGNIGGRRATDVLAAVVRGDRRSADLRFAAARALAGAGDARGLDLLNDHLVNGDDMDRWVTLRALSKLPDSRTVDALISILKHEGFFELRRMAAERLGEIRDARAIPALLDALIGGKDRGTITELAFSQALVSIGQGGADALVERLDDDRPSVRAAAAGALSWFHRCGSRAGIDRLATMVSNDPSMEARRAAALTLGSVVDDRATRAILTALRDPALSTTAASSLRTNGGAYDPLIDALDDPDATIRTTAFEALTARVRYEYSNGRYAPRVPDAAAWRAWRRFKTQTIDLRGSVAGADGRPLAGLLVICSVVQPGGGVLFQSYGVVDMNPRGLSDAGGRFELEDREHFLEPGARYTLHVLDGDRSQVLTRDNVPVTFSIDIYTTDIDMGSLSPIRPLK